MTQLPSSSVLFFEELGEERATGLSPPPVLTPRYSGTLPILFHHPLSSDSTDYLITSNNSSPPQHTKRHFELRSACPCNSVEDVDRTQETSSCQRLGLWMGACSEKKPCSPRFPIFTFHTIQIHLVLSSVHVEACHEATYTVR